MIPTEKTAKTSEEKQAVSAPAITLPKGGGAIRGMGEKFTANPVTGTGSLTVPIFTSPGRSGFSPQLSLSYDSGAGNGPFGFGWNLSLPSISRKTDKGLPRYLDAEESDEFILSGAEDFVPIYRQDPDGSWVASHPGCQRDPDGFWVRDREGRLVMHEDERDGYRVQRYRPRIEGLFARIERWTNLSDPQDTFWRSISKDNITTWYGKNSESRIFDPADPSRIFSWLICESYDDKGNVIAYRYAEENSNRIFEDQNGKPIGLAHERNRSDETCKANRYLKRIFYGNRVPFLPQLLEDQAWPKPPENNKYPNNPYWLFEVVFDYGENHCVELPLNPDLSELEQHRYASATLSPQQQWKPRPDPFSSYRAGFEIRTYRLCQQVLMFHHFPGESGVGAGCLVRSTDFTYRHEQQPSDPSAPIHSFLVSVTQSGYVRQGASDQYLTKSFPPVELEYTDAVVQETLGEIDPEALENLPYGLDNANYQWVDLDGEGLSGILTEQAQGWFYKPNLSPIHTREVNGKEILEACFGPLETVIEKPSLAALRGGRQQLLDLAGDGQLDLVELADPTAGFYERTEDSRWESFVPFESHPNLDWSDPNLRFVDLTGDGRADILVAEEEVFTWYPSLGETGFGPAIRMRQALDEEQEPRLVFADGAQSIYLSDMSGDGLNDLVRIRNGEVCYWPNLGYGRFGAKVAMDEAPWFDRPDQFDQRRLRLADIDGSGNCDLIYLATDAVHLYFNQSGNSWSAPTILRCFPPTDNLAVVQAVDLLGNGTACLVWSSPLPGNAKQPLNYLDLMGGQKPHLLVKTSNNLGAETRVTYAPSTKFYLNDKLDGKPWITKIPFPVHVVERVETYDWISGNRFVTRYAYHHGYYDGIEREFRGFGRVEQWDTEEFDVLGKINPVVAVGGEGETTNIEAASHVPPVHTKTWYHTGFYLDRERISRQYEPEYYREPGLSDLEIQSLLLPDTVLPAGLTPEEEREACRALKGMMLRQEVYADDAPPGSSPEVSQRAATPYTVVEQNFAIHTVQHRGGNCHAVFFTHPGEAITYHYERKQVPVLNGWIVDETEAESNPDIQWLTDPRIQHALTLEVDDFGNVLKSAAIGYGRRRPYAGLSDQDPNKQTRTLITFTENRFAGDALTYVIDKPDAYRTPLPAESRTYELRLAQPKEGGEGLTPRFSFTDVSKIVAQAGDDDHDVDYEDLYFAKAQDAVQRDPEGPEKATEYFRRLLEAVRTLYRPDDLGGAASDALTLLPLCDLQPLALPGESYKLAFTPGLLRQVYVRDRDRDGEPEPLLPADVSEVLEIKNLGADRGGYVDLDGNGHWWIPSGRMFYSPKGDDSPSIELACARDHFFLPRRYRAPFHTEASSTESFVDYDAYDLLVQETRDARGNQVTVGQREWPIADQSPLPAVGGNNYRVLQPALVMDPNGNRTQVAFDALGLVAGTAVMGKPDEQLGDSLDGFEPDLTQRQIDDFQSAEDPHAPAPNLLRKAGSRIIYDLESFLTTRLDHPDAPAPWSPVFAATLARETHASDLWVVDDQPSKIQISFSYSDGLGREIQKKIQAEPGLAPVRDDQGVLRCKQNLKDTPVRWVGSGRTIFNNKGKPVKQYEPFFSPTHGYEKEKELVECGVTPVLFYDPLDRVIATLHPNHTYEKVVFGPWGQTTYDVNDTVAPHAKQTGDPRTDPDIAGYVGDYFKTQPDDWKTWYAERIDKPADDPECGAAQKAASHADTPTIVHFDTLGRPFLTIAHNRVACPNHPLDGKEGKFHTRVEIDIEGNQRTVRDADTRAHDEQGHEFTNELGRIVMRYDYDLLGNRIHQQSMEAGERWMLNDVAGKPIRAWDSRGHHFRSEYDALRRPTRQYVRGTDAERSDPRTLDREVLFALTEYGEDHTEAEKLNFRTRVYRQCDGAGVITNMDGNEAYDFKGNLLRGTRQLMRDYKALADWSAAPVLEDEIFHSATTYDALNRPLTLTAPDGSITSPGYNEANLLQRMDVQLPGSAAATTFVTNIDYNAKGQRELIDYGNGASTHYEYDPLTFRLDGLRTTRPAGPNGLGSQIFKDNTVVQDLHYTYDPVGNITRLADQALPTLFYDNQQVEPVGVYTYDAVYRLIEAKGRESIGQSALQLGLPRSSYRDYPFAGLGAQPSDPKAVRNYTEQYEYDAVGNFVNLIHQAQNGGWTRGYTYRQTSLTERERAYSNRLSQTSIGNTNEPYTHDAHGNMTSMPHLSEMRWDFLDRLLATSCQVVNDDPAGNVVAEKTWYVYDGAGQRVLKVTERQNGTPKKERIYLSGFEVYREYNGGTQVLALERNTLHVMDDKQRIALVETRTQGDDGSPARLIRYQFGNHLGSVMLELDEASRTISFEEYHPYGTSSYQASNKEIKAVAKRYRYTGKERDEETGFYYHGARYYSTWLGRWITCDPAGLIDGVNIYQYSNRNPLRFFDEKGCQSNSPTTPTPVVDVVAVLFGGNRSDIQANRMDRFLRKNYGEPNSPNPKIHIRRSSGDIEWRRTVAASGQQAIDIVRDITAAAKKLQGDNIQATKVIELVLHGNTSGIARKYESGVLIDLLSVNHLSAVQDFRREVARLEKRIETAEKRLSDANAKLRGASSDAEQKEQRDAFTNVQEARKDLNEFLNRPGNAQAKSLSDAFKEAAEALRNAKIQTINLQSCNTGSGNSLLSFIGRLQNLLSSSSSPAHIVTVKGHWEMVSTTKAGEVFLGTDPIDPQAQRSTTTLPQPP